MRSPLHGRFARTIFSAALMLSTYGIHAQCFNNWTYNMPLVISNTNTADLNDFQVPVTVNTAALIAANKMNANGSDIRFVTSLSCCTSLSYYIDSAINTNSTLIWVRVPYVMAGGTDTIHMLYGNTAADSMVSNGAKVFNLWEDFNGPTTHFTNVCNNGVFSETLGGGDDTYEWETDAIWASDSTFPISTVYTADAKVVSAAGDWPGIYWIDSSGVGGFGLSTSDASSFFDGNVEDDGDGFCNPIGLGNALNSSTPDGAGIWSFTWTATALQEGSYPGYGYFSFPDPTWTRDQSLKLCLGSIDGGEGHVVFDWVRVRKYAAVLPTTSPMAEISYAATALSYPDTSYCVSADTAIATHTGMTGGTITSSPAGLVINSSNGNVNLATSAPGTYTVTYSVASADTCAYTATTTINIVAAPTATITASGLSLNTTGTFATYQWYRNGVAVAGATSQQYTAVHSGTYYLAVTNAGGCSAHSNSIPLVAAGVAIVAGIENMSIYPNPNNGAFTISGDINVQATSLQIEITDVTGRVVYTDSAPIANNKVTKAVTMNRQMAAGTYMLRLIADGQKKTLPFIIK